MPTRLLHHALGHDPVEALNWNCPQHITQRYSLADVEQATASLRQRVAELETELASSRASGA